MLQLRSYPVLTDPLWFSQALDCIPSEPSSRAASAGSDTTLNSTASTLASAREGRRRAEKAERPRARTRTVGDARERHRKTTARKRGEKSELKASEKRLSGARAAENPLSLRLANS